MHYMKYFVIDRHFMNISAMKKLFVVLIIATLIYACSSEKPERKWTAEVLNDHLVVKIPGTGKEATFEPSFLVLYQSSDPKMALRPGNIPGVSYNVVSWENQDLNAEDLLAEMKRDEAQFGDGFDASVLDAQTQKRTADVFKSGERIEVRAIANRREGAKVIYEFPSSERFDFSASIDLSSELPFPKLRFELKPKKKGYYSVAYVGAPQYAPESLDALWQPMLWQEKRFPHQAFMTMAYRCPIPTTLACQSGHCVGVVAAPEEFPFSPLPLAENSRFGVALRNPEGLAQPTLFAPVIGGMNSKMEESSSFNFQAYLYFEAGTDTEAYESIARNIYDFKDYRNNALGPLNVALDNMIDYGMSDYSWFVDSLKGCAYSTDVPGAVKNVSSLNPLQIALLTGRKDVFEKRAYPIIEYLLSREKFLFSLDKEQKIQNPSRNMTGPVAPLTELTSLYNITDGKSPVFLDLAKVEFGKARARNLEKVEKGSRWQNALALYEATNKQEYLDQAVEGAKEYLNKRQTEYVKDFTTEPTSYFFWTTFTNDWINLLRLYEVSKEEQFLKAAREGARHYTQFTWLSPSIPDVEIKVNEGGKAPLYWYLKSKGHIQMMAEEEEVPAWRLSSIGLTPESSGTCNGHRGIFMANYAPWMLRIAHYTGDEFLKDVARSAIIGRYTNFPGYHINTARTTVYEKPDYPLRPFKELSVNSMHFNHIWPHMSILVDYLLTDALLKSEGEINFPTEFIEGYAYLQSNFYSGDPGKFYDVTDAILYMPQRMLTTSSPQLNYISARSSEGLLIAFMNQSNEEVRSTIQLDKDILPLIEGQNYRLISWKKGERTNIGEVEDGKFEIVVPSEGLSAFLIEGLNQEPAFQKQLLGQSEEASWTDNYQEIPIGGSKAMILHFSSEIQNLYVYASQDDSQWQSFQLNYQFDNGESFQMADEDYPFEFTVPIPEDAQSVAVKVIGINQNNKKDVSDWVRFKK